MNFIKKNIKLILGIVIGAVLISGISVYATYTYLASDVKYTKNNSEISVEQALNELYASNLYEVLESGTYTSSNVLSGQYIQQTINLENTYTESDNVYFIIKNITLNNNITPYVDLINTGNCGINTKIIGNTAKFYLNNGAGNNANGSITIDYAIVKKKF